MIDWEIMGAEFVNCNCSYGCPCQFNALPTHGNCEAAAGFRVDTGHFGQVKLDGLHGAGVYAWPGPIHEGEGKMQLIVDERADDEQRNALLTIMRGHETQPMATMWSVYTAMCSTELPPLFKPIDLRIDVANRTGRIVVPGVYEMSGQPIRNPVTGNPHRVRIDMPEGFEYSLAEIGSGSTSATGEISLNLENTYGQFAELHLSGSGVVRAGS